MKDPSTITADSKISIALFTSILGGVLVIAVTAVSATFSATRWASRVDIRLENIDRSLLEVTTSPWRQSDMETWVKNLSQNNPQLVVPLALRR